MTAIVADAFFWGLLIAAAFIAGRESRGERTPKDGTASDVAMSLQLLVDEGLISVEDRETHWRRYVTKVRTP